MGALEEKARNEAAIDEILVLIDVGRSRNSNRILYGVYVILSFSIGEVWLFCNGPNPSARLSLSKAEI